MGHPHQKCRNGEQDNGKHHPRDSCRSVVSLVPQEFTDADKRKDGSNCIPPLPEAEAEPGEVSFTQW